MSSPLYDTDTITGTVHHLYTVENYTFRLDSTSFWNIDFFVDKMVQFQNRHRQYDVRCSTFVLNCTYPCRPLSLLFVHPGKFPHVFLGRSLLARISQHNSSLAPRNQQCRAFDSGNAHRTPRVRVIMSMNDAAIEAQEAAARELAKLLPSPDLLSNLARIRADYAARQQVRPSSVRHPR